jgi:hypothetical protein
VYIERLRDALAAAETIREDAPHAKAVIQIVEICVDAKDTTAAQRLVSTIRTAIIRDSVAARFDLKSKTGPGESGLNTP